MSVNNFKNLPQEMLPREQMRMAASAADLTSDALLAILLKTGAPGCDVLELSRRLISAFGGIRNLVSQDWRSLKAGIASYNAAHPNRTIRGIGDVKVLELAAAFELVRRECIVSYADLKHTEVRTPESAIAIFKAFVDTAAESERFYILPLDAKCHPLSVPIVVANGCEDGVAVSVRDVFRFAIKWAANSIVIAHNHPTGDPAPSHEDVRVTIELLEAAKLIGVQVIDHLILGVSGCTSLRKKVPDLWTR